MKSLFSLVLLFLVPWLWGSAVGKQALGVMLGSCCGAPVEACGSPQKPQRAKAGSESPWTSTYLPVRSCHRVLQDKYGEFSPPAYHSDFPVNLWCNWTIWAGSRHHIVIYIQGFTTEEDCSTNEDAILFEGVSSLVANGVVYACWKKEIHVFATFAQAVHVVLLKRSLPSCRNMQFRGTYYIFQHQEGGFSFETDVVSEIPALNLPKQDDISQSGGAGNLGDVLDWAAAHSSVSLGKNTVFSGEFLQRRGIMLGTTAVGGPVDLVLYEHARTPHLETTAPSALESELPGGLRCYKEAQAGGTTEGIIPTAAQESWGLSMSGDITVGVGPVHKLPSVLLETPLRSALQPAEPFLLPADVGLEDYQSVLHPTPRLKDLVSLLFAVTPTHVSWPDLPVHLQPLSPGGGGSKASRESSRYGELSTVSLGQDGSHSWLSVPADGTAGGDAGNLATGLMPSLSKPYETANGDHLLPQRYQSSLGDLSVTWSELAATSLWHMEIMDVSSLGCFRRGVKGKAASHPIPTQALLQEQLCLCGVSCQVLQSASADPGSHLANAQERDSPSTERTSQPGLPVHPLPTELEHPPTAVFTPGTERVSALLVSCTDPVPADFGSTCGSPEAPLPPEEVPVPSIVFSQPAALDLDLTNLEQRASTSLDSPERQEMGSPSPFHLPSLASKLGTEKSRGSPGVEVLREAGHQPEETLVSVDLPDRGPSPASITSLKPGMGLPQPENHMSSGSGVAAASQIGVRREEHVVQHQVMAAGDNLASASILGGSGMQKTTEDLSVSAGEQRAASFSASPVQLGPHVAWWGQPALRGQKTQKPSEDPASSNTQMPGGQQQKHAELGPPWAVEYFPMRSCHIVFQDDSGVFYLPLHANVETSIWCNWTILAGSQKHVVIYVQGFQGSGSCSKNYDMMIFQGMLSSVETKVVHACLNQGTVIFAAQAAAVHVVLLLGSSSLSREYRHFKGQYYVFRNSVGSSGDAVCSHKPVQEVSKEDRWGTAVIRESLSTQRPSPGPPDAFAGGKIQPEFVSPYEEKAQYPPDPMEDAQSGANLSKLDLNESDQLQDKTELERSIRKGDGLVEQPPAEQDSGHKAELSAVETAKRDVELTSTLVTTTPCLSVGASSEVFSSSAGVSAKLPTLGEDRDRPWEGAAPYHTQTSRLEGLLWYPSTKPSLHPSPSVTAGDAVFPEERNGELLDLVSVLASLEEDTALQSQHHPGDVLFEVTTEIKPKDWIPGGGRELQENLPESMKKHIQENLKLSAHRVSEIKLKELRRTHDANLLLTFWLHLKLEERNTSLLLRSQLEELLGTSTGAEKLQLVSLLVEDVNECSTGVGLCGEEAECLNSVGTYLCRCKQDYEDHSPTKSGTLCIRVPRSGAGFFLRHADILVGAAIVAALAMLVAAGVMCRAGRWRQQSRRNQSPEEPSVRAAEEPVLELHDLKECLCLEPFQLKLRARPPEWLWSARTHSNQTYQVFLEQSPQL